MHRIKSRPYDFLAIFYSYNRSFLFDYQSFTTVRADTKYGGFLERIDLKVAERDSLKAVLPVKTAPESQSSHLAHKSDNYAIFLGYYLKDY